MHKPILYQEGEEEGEELLALAGDHIEGFTSPMGGWDGKGC